MAQSLERLKSPSSACTVLPSRESSEFLTAFSSAENIQMEGGYEKKLSTRSLNLRRRSTTTHPGLQHTCAHIHTYFIHTYTHICMYIPRCTYAHIRICTHRYTHVHTYLHACIHTYTHACIYLHMHMRTYTHTDTHICTYTHTCTYTPSTDHQASQETKASSVKAFG